MPSLCYQALSITTSFSPLRIVIRTSYNRSDLITNTLNTLLLLTLLKRIIQHIRHHIVHSRHHYSQSTPDHPRVRFFRRCSISLFRNATNFFFTSPIFHHLLPKHPPFSSTPPRPPSASRTRYIRG